MPISCVVHWSFFALLDGLIRMICIWGSYISSYALHMFYIWFARPLLLFRGNSLLVGHVMCDLLRWSCIWKKAETSTQLDMHPTWLCAWPQAVGWTTGFCDLWERYVRVSKLQSMWAQRLAATLFRLSTLMFAWCVSSLVVNFNFK